MTASAAHHGRLLDVEAETAHALSMPFYNALALLRALRVFVDVAAVLEEAVIALFLGLRAGAASAGDTRA